MVALLCFVLRLLVSPFRPISRLEAENAALRRQLIVLQRQVRGRVQFANSDREYALGCAAVVFHFAVPKWVQWRAIACFLRGVSFAGTSPPLAGTGFRGLSNPRCDCNYDSHQSTPHMPYRTHRNCEGELQRDSLRSDCLAALWSRLVPMLRASKTGVNNMPIPRSPYISETENAT